MPSAPLVFRYPCAPTPVKAALRADVQQSVTRAQQKLPRLGHANPDGTFVIEQLIDDWLPDSDGDGLEDDAPEPVAEAAAVDPQQRRVSDLWRRVRSAQCDAAQQDRIRHLIDDFQVGALDHTTGTEAAVITTHYLRRIDDVLVGATAIVNPLTRARHAHQLSHQAHERSAMAKVYSANARLRLRRSA